MQNFAFPYFSRDIAEFWRRWHISLSTWFRDYLYIPLGGSRGSIWLKIRNTFIIFIVSGFWHGANWTFIVWGGLNAIYFLPLLLTNNNRNNIEIVAKGKIFPSFQESYKMLLTFSLTVFAWIFFRAENIDHAFNYIRKIFSISILNPIYFNSMKPLNLIVIPCLVFFFITEWLGREYMYAIEGMWLRWNRVTRWTFYIGIIICLFIFSSKEQEFIYFQF